MVKNNLVSVNILTYNAQDLIGPCLRSVLKQTHKNVEILVVDNASKDKTLERVKKFPVKVIKNKENLGFAAGHNVGIRKSRGEYVLCLNQDVVLDKDFVKYAVEVMEKDEEIAAVQGKLMRVKDLNGLQADVIDTTGLAIFKNRRAIARGSGEKDRGQYDSPSTGSGRESKIREIFGVDGAAPLYRRRALEDIKINNEYFDEDFFMFKEDVDLAWRMRLYGRKAVYEPKAVAYHLRGAGEKAVKDYVSVALARRKISQFAKFHSFKNDRLMRIKNELPALFFRDFCRIIIKEIAAWVYVLLFERYTWKAIKELFKQAPNSWRKRKIIMKKKKVGAKEMKKWFI